MNPETWIVLVIGIATVASQFLTARATGKVAEQQLAATGAALRSELQSVLVFTRGSYSTEAGSLQVHNGGRYAAIDLRVGCIDEDGSVFASGRSPVINPMSDQTLEIRLGSVEKREAFASCSTVLARWSDGTGPREESVVVLPRE